MLSDGKILEELKKRHEEYERIKKQYSPMSPFVSDVNRSRNIRVSNPLCPIYPYEQY